MPQLTTTDHSRDIAALTYIYPVLSRRAEGLSIGVNFNTNNRCNWRCVYCQVPNLQRGSAPSVDLQLLAEELRLCLASVQSGDFFAKFQVPSHAQSIKDIAISGNGEPTTLPNFNQAVQLIADIACEFGIFPASRLVLISNGSFMHRPAVQQGLCTINKLGGEVWFKIDSATPNGRQQINNNRQSTHRLLDNLAQSASLCNTAIQTCCIKFLATDKMAQEQASYLKLLSKIKQSRINISKIMLYSVTRPILQPEANKITQPSHQYLKAFAQQLQDLGYKVSINL